MYRLLSHPYTGSDPAWPGSPQVRLEECLSMDKGDMANTYLIRIYNHLGTHFDAPAHYVRGGPAIGELPLERFVYRRPLLLDVPKGRCEKVEPADLEGYASRISECDLLMIRTGFSQYRTADREQYEAYGPAVSAACAEYLVSAFPNLSALALDFVSLASYQEQPDGNRAHRIILGEGREHFICVIEDVEMRQVRPERLLKVFALPLFIRGADSCPVTVLAEEAD